MVSAEKITRNILDWYAKNKRDLLWRKTHDPYKIWVSEVMLQQTQVTRVLDYYQRFLKKFPDIKTLAKADWQVFLPYWQGLGFYSRGKNMLKTAAEIMKTYHGKFPETVQELEKLPGIGKYTAAAILSFAKNEPVPAIDTNITRVIQRVYGCTEKGVGVRAQALMNAQKKQAGAVNHALMDLGATICKSRKPECQICPLQKDCHFLQSGKKAAWEKTLLSAPRKNIRSQKILMEVAVACIHQNGKYLICKRRPEKGGFWEFPGGKREIGEDWRHCLKREIQEELGVDISVRPHFFETVWSEKEFFWRLRFFRCQILQGTPKIHEHSALEWVKPNDLGQYEFPKANMNALEKLQKMRV